MFTFQSKLTRTIVAMAIIVVVSLVNVAISSATAGVALIELLSFGVHRYVSLGVALLVAVVVFLYIMKYGYKLSQYVMNQGADNNE